jgi:formate hydrogenlyase transcriptional activator
MASAAAYQFRPVPTEGTQRYRSLDEEEIRLSELVSTSMFEEIVGSSDAINRVTDQILKVAPSDATVLITGESGTGKELIVRAIHRKSNRSRRPLVCMNCAATPPSLIAAELFGHERGTFTDANQLRAGRFEVANHSTLFLDEIGDMPIEAQCALLRVLQERQLERVGGNRTIPVDVRVIAATNCDLSTTIKSGRFRLDLFYRLNIFPIHVPPLRERPEDILPLARYFIERYAARGGKRIRYVDKRTAQFLEAWPWPGNIRELQNVIERSVILCDTETLAVEEAGLSSTSESLYGPQPRRTSGEKEHIEAVLVECRGRISGPNGAASKLGIRRTTLESWIKKLRIINININSRFSSLAAETPISGNPPKTSHCLPTQVVNDKRRYRLSKQRAPSHRIRPFPGDLAWCQRL